MVSPMTTLFSLPEVGRLLLRRHAFFHEDIYPAYQDALESYTAIPSVPDDLID
jgi:hypothetical protein